MIYTVIHTVGLYREDGSIGTLTVIKLESLKLLNKPLGTNVPTSLATICIYIAKLKLDAESFKWNCKKKRRKKNVFGIMWLV